ncbi:MAG: NADH-quinone oxidoreductase subunit NuoN [Candidatus Nanopelagicales bacterium]|nr:NADH-quinone oxidoreductase subunit NuoN [Candidatus Nanopelagicales bacterium]
MSILAAVSVDVPFTLPIVDYNAIAPLLILLGAGVISVLVEALLPRGSRRFVQLFIVLGSLIASLAWIFTITGVRIVTAEGAIAIDGPALVMQGAILMLAILGALLMAERSVDPSGDVFAARASALPGSEDEKQFTARGYLQTEVWPLFLFAVSGMVLFVSANDLLLMFVALEVMSLPLYLLAGMARRRRLLSQEAALKYFLLGAFSSAFFIYGVALVYGYAASTQLPVIASVLTAKPGQTSLALIAMALILVGLLFKVAAVPFHQWTPDVYQGAPTAVTGFMAATVKIAAFGALMRVLYVAFGGMRWDWVPMMSIIAILTMLVGSIIAISQSDIKRMLAYSSIAQAGFILVGVIAASPAGLAGALFYLIAYGFTTIGAFAVISLVRDESGEATNLSKWAGLGRKSPLVGSIFALFMLGLAGIPLTSGFIGKFSVFAAALASGDTWLVIVAVVASLIAAFFYVRVIVAMFFTESGPQTASVVVPSVFTTIALAAGATVTLVLGILPQPVLELVSNAGLFIR